MPFLRAWDFWSYRIVYLKFLALNTRVLLPIKAASFWHTLLLASLILYGGDCYRFRSTSRSVEVIGRRLVLGFLVENRFIYHVDSLLPSKIRSPHRQHNGWVITNEMSKFGYPYDSESIVHSFLECINFFSDSSICFTISGSRVFGLQLTSCPVEV